MTNKDGSSWAIGSEDCNGGELWVYEKEGGAVPRAPEGGDVPAFP